MKIKKAKIIHDNLNAGGGSERLAFATIELLNEMGNSTIHEKRHTMPLN